MTVKNPSGTYRIPIERAKVFHVESVGINIAITGEMVDRLGAYEELGMTPEEIKKVLKDGNYTKK